MAIQSIDGKLPRADVMQQRIGAGTVGQEHATPGSQGKQAAAAVTIPFDGRLSYAGSWFAQVGQNAVDYLGQNVYSDKPGSVLSFQFTGTSVAIIGMTRDDGGRADIYVDGVLQEGSVNTYTYLAASYGLSGLSATATTINVASTSGFSSTGKIIIDGEVITYTGTTGTSFTGCTRTGSTTHRTGATVTAYTSEVEFYSPYRQSRVTLWSNSQLSPGDHTLQVVVRSDKNASSSDTLVYINCLVTNGLLGAGNIITHLDYAELLGVAFDGTGFATVPWSLSASTTTQQILGILGAATYSGGSFAGICFVGWRADTNQVYLYAPLDAGFTRDVVITTVVLGASI